MKSLRPEQLVVDENYYLHGFDGPLVCLDAVGVSVGLPGSWYASFSWNGGPQFNLAYFEVSESWHYTEYPEADQIMVLHHDLLVHLNLTCKEEAER